MIKIFNKIKLDVARPNEFAVVPAKQGDRNSRFITAAICLDGNFITVPRNATVKLNVIRADGVGTSFDGYVMDDGCVTVPIDRWISAVVGESRCSIEISHGEQILTTMRFTVKTEESDDVNDIGDPDIVPTDPEYDAVVEMLEDYKNGRFGSSEVFVRYSSEPDGEGYTKEWSEGQSFIGFASSRTEPTDKSGYSWSRFMGEDGETVEVLQQTGESESAVMSQKAVTGALSELFGKLEDQRIEEIVPVRSGSVADRYIPFADSDSGILFDTAFPLCREGDSVSKSRIPMLFKWYGLKNLRISTVIKEAGDIEYRFSLTKEPLGVEIYDVTIGSVVYYGVGSDIGIRESADGNICFVIFDGSGEEITTITDLSLAITPYTAAELPEGCAAQTADTYRVIYADGNSVLFDLLPTAAENGGSVEIVGSVGESESAVMSQKAVTEAIKTTNERIDSIPFDSIKGMTVEGNQIPYCVEETVAGYYCYVDNGRVSFLPNELYTCYKIRVRPTVYYLGQAFVAICDENGTPLNTHQSGITSIDVSKYPTAKYAWYSCVDNKKIFSTGFSTSDSYYVNELDRRFNDHEKKAHDTSTNIDLAWTSSIQKGLIFAFSADVSESFANLVIVYQNEGNARLRIDVGTSTLKVTDYLWGTSVVNTYQHGLKVTNNLQVFIRFTGKNTVNIELASGGEKFVQNNIPAYKIYSCNPYIWAADGTIFNTVISATCEDLGKDIWAFGDSYFSYSETRWIKHLFDSGYEKNILMNAYSGAASANAFKDLEKLLPYGNPKYVFWCMGMNDGSDTDEDTPNIGWKTNIESLIAKCKAYNITPILATIPTVPSVYNEGKNKWIRNSGYQYVDFARAVGASSEGNWYDGMLSSDGIHPDVKGGVALYYRVLADFPQITVG